MAMIHTSRTQLNIGIFQKDSANMNVILSTRSQLWAIIDGNFRIESINKYQAIASIFEWN